MRLGLAAPGLLELDVFFVSYDDLLRFAIDCALLSNAQRDICTKSAAAPNGLRCLMRPFIVGNAHKSMREGVLCLD